MFVGVLRVAHCPTENYSTLDIVTQANLFPLVAPQRVLHSSVPRSVWPPIATIVRMDALVCIALAIVYSTVKRLSLGLVSTNPSQRLDG